MITTLLKNDRYLFYLSVFPFCNFQWYALITVFLYWLHDLQSYMTLVISTLSLYVWVEPGYPTSLLGMFFRGSLWRESSMRARIFFLIRYFFGTFILCVSWTVSASATFPARLILCLFWSVSTPATFHVPGSYFVYFVSGTPSRPFLDSTLVHTAHCAGLMHYPTIYQSIARSISSAAVGRRTNVAIN